ncbi:MAG: hypothetical protein IBJ17_11560, partial [Reyranella sp.]|nr:hypothetical protein [Reyranella sp.]
MTFSRPALAWSAAGLLAALLLPWYALQAGLDDGGWVAGLWTSEEDAGGLAQALAHGRWGLLPPLAALLACCTIALLPLPPARPGAWLLPAGAAGLRPLAPLAVAL